MQNVMTTEIRKEQWTGQLEAGVGPDLPSLSHTVPSACPLHCLLLVMQLSHHYIYSLNTLIIPSLKLPVVSKASHAFTLGPTVLG